MRTRPVYPWFLGVIPESAAADGGVSTPRKPGIDLEELQRQREPLAWSRPICCPTTAQS